jgi:hypothetical protein
MLLVRCITSWPGELIGVRFLEITLTGTISWIALGNHFRDQDGLSCLGTDSESFTP